MIDTLYIETAAKEQLIDITSKIQQQVLEKGIKEGICHLFVPHTTAGIMLNENMDPDVKHDILLALERMVPDKGFKHYELNSAAHVKSMITGVSKTLFIKSGRLQLNTWQGIFFCEFDGPRHRKLYIKIVGDDID